jgi:tetratricopeptide (TPR) repeat protein
MVRGSFSHPRLPENGKNGRRLTGWKTIGQHLGCSSRTAMCWEAEREMPIHRLPGGSRSSVWANPDELTAWLTSFRAEDRATLRAEASSGGQATRGNGQETSSATARELASPAARVRSRLAPTLVATVTIAAAAVAVLVVWASRHLRAPPAAVTHTPYDDNPRARDLYLTARFEVANRTADSLRAAESDYQQLVKEYPDRAAGWSGLADTYILLPEFASEPGAVTFPKAARAARTALALDPNLAEGWLDKAYVAWWWQGDAATAFPAFATALKLNPGSATAYHWYATALESHGELHQALDAIARARALDPNNRAIVADEAEIRFDSGQRMQALQTVEQLAKLDPQFVSWHLYLAHFYLLMGRDADYLHEAITVAELRGLPDVVASLRVAEQRLHEGGRQAMLDQLSASERRGTHGAGYVVTIARYRALAGDRAGMLHWLGVALAQHDHELVRATMYPEFEPFRNDREFRKIVSQAIYDASRDAAIETASSR